MDLLDVLALFAGIAVGWLAYSAGRRRGHHDGYLLGQIDAYDDALTTLRRDPNVEIDAEHLRRQRDLGARRLQ